MNNDRQIVDLIERTNDAKPSCPCGRHTTTVWRDGAVWLECVSLSRPHEGRVARILAGISAPTHLREHIVDVRAATASEPAFVTAA